jgi:hypothetical protein
MQGESTETTLGPYFLEPGYLALLLGSHGRVSVPNHTSCDPFPFLRRTSTDDWGSLTGFVF